MDKNVLEKLSQALEGELQTDALSKALYATDASVYRKIPTAVCFPKHAEDLKKLVHFANENKVGLIPRTAGTSLAGQCVGEGIVVDTSKYFTKIGPLNEKTKQIVVEPGVVRDELNRYLKPFGLFFGPNTSTSNRCMIGGMVGNNSSGTTSIQYGVTRDKVVAMRTVLADGGEVVFEEVTPERFMKKVTQNDFEGRLYQTIQKELSDTKIQESIRTEFPKPEIHRRNTGYAIDGLLESAVFTEKGAPFNFSHLLSGSEGTLAFTTEITLQLDDLPPEHAAMVATHYHSLEDCLADVAVTMQHNLFMCEMMDKVILDCTKNNRQQMENRFFVEGDPAGVLMLEVRATSAKELDTQVTALLKTIATSGLSYHHPVLYGDDIQKAIALRKAGLGLLGNMVGDRKAVACIEDTAVALGDLKDFIGEFTKIMSDFGQEAVYYAHAGAGELHLRPILNLKRTEDVVLFRKITTEVAKLTKRYRGSFSGEHGDGIVRAEFIPLMIGDANYALLKRIKTAFDPNGIFNPGKIVDAHPMDASLRYEVDREEPQIETFLDFSDSEGILKAVEKCNGSGDCRKSADMGGAMCPSYHATKSEQHTTRGRANTLREFLTGSEKTNRFDHDELKSVFDLCLSCKACASECPSNVDVATLKAEFQYQYQEANGYSWRNKLFAHNTKINRLAVRSPKLVNRIYRSGVGSLLKRMSGVAAARSFPELHRFDFDAYLKQQRGMGVPTKSKVALYIDEFTRYMDVSIGKDAIDLLIGLGYEVRLFYAESGRTYLSKGFLKQAKALAKRNVEKARPFVDEKIPIVGLEPSAVLSFRDEYPRLLEASETVKALAASSFLIEEFLAAEIAAGRVTADRFTEKPRTVKIHGHCHQKALSNQKVTFDLLNLPKNYKVSIIASGCCGMAGSFGYEAEHYDISMQVGALKLFPSIKKSDPNVLISANGTSCRHQIQDGTGRTALHPISILREALVI
ncbi:MAG: FAD-binding protein [Flavobacteriaceae bacterium]|nr:FAD-binding protein [Flavobacteriaceae bacterium]